MENKLIYRMRLTRTAMLIALFGYGCVSNNNSKELIDLICPSYYIRGQGSHAEFITRELGYGKAKKAIWTLVPKRLKQEFIPKRGSEVYAMEVLQEYKQQADLGFAWTEKNRRIKIPECQSTLTIDGSISNGEWGNAYVFSGEYVLNSCFHQNNESRWYVMHDKNMIYFAAKFKDNFFQVNKQHLYLGDSLELFIMSEVGSGIYWEIIATPGEKKFYSLHIVDHKGNKITRFIYPERIQVEAKFKSGYLMIEVAIPFDIIFTSKIRPPTYGSEINFMMVRTNMCKHEYYKSAPCPFLYDGHNIYGYIKVIF